MRLWAHYLNANASTTVALAEITLSLSARWGGRNGSESHDEYGQGNEFACESLEHDYFSFVVSRRG